MKRSSSGGTSKASGKFNASFNSPDRAHRVCRTPGCTSSPHLQASDGVRRIPNTTGVRPVVPRFLCNGSNCRHAQNLCVDPKRRLRKHIRHPHHSHRPQLSPYSCVWAGDRPLMDRGKRTEEVAVLFPKSIPPPPGFLPPSLSSRPHRIRQRPVKQNGGDLRCLPQFISDVPLESQAMGGYIIVYYCSQWENTMYWPPFQNPRGWVSGLQNPE